MVITLEDGILDGGFGEKIARFYGNSDVKVLNYGLKKEFLDRYDVTEVLKKNHLTKEQIAEDIEKNFTVKFEIKRKEPGQGSLFRLFWIGHIANKFTVYAWIFQYFGYNQKIIFINH